MLDEQGYVVSLFPGLLYDGLLHVTHNLSLIGSASPCRLPSGQAHPIPDNRLPPSHRQPPCRMAISTIPALQGRSRYTSW